MCNRCIIKIISLLGGNFFFRLVYSDNLLAVHVLALFSDCSGLIWGVKQHKVLMSLELIHISLPLRSSYFSILFEMDNTV